MVDNMTIKDISRWNIEAVAGDEFIDAEEIIMTMRKSANP